MRLLALFSLLLLIAALVLNVLLLLAGTTTSFLTDASIISLNTSDVGGTLLTSSSSPVASAVAAAGPSASAIASALTSSAANSVAQAVGLHDFYDFYVQDWCEGYYTPSPTAANATKNVTSCSTRGELWQLNLTQILASELKTGYAVSQLEMPSAVNDGFDVLQTAFKVMFIFFCITIGLTAVGVLGALAALVLDGRVSACFMGIWTLLDAACAVVASALATVIAYSGSAAVNGYQTEVGAVATRGTKFMAMTWAAAGLLVVAWLVWCVDCCVGGRDRRRFGNYRPAKKEVY